MLRQSSYFEQIRKAWKLFAYNNHVAEEPVMDVDAAPVVAPTKKQGKMRGPNDVRHNISEEDAFDQLCTAFRALSVPWCEIHTRSGKLIVNGDRSPMLCPLSMPGNQQELRVLQKLQRSRCQ